MESVRSTWTDERLDDLTNRMDRGFDRVDADIRALSGRIDHLGTRLDSMQRITVTLLISILSGVVVMIIGLAATNT